MNDNIFHDYDIRGRYPAEVNEQIFYKLGLAIAQTFKPKKVAIGRDGRLSAGTLFLYLAAGLAKSQRPIKIIDLGRASTPFCFWYSQKYRTDALMITASHNTKDQNGLKIYRAKRGPVDKESGLLKIQEKYKVLPAELEFARESKKIKKAEALAMYQKFILSKFPRLNLKRAKLKLAIDFSNGTAGREIIPILEKIKVDFATLNEKTDGRFPGHGPNPLDETSQKAISLLVKSKKFNLGALLDGDGDRIMFFDEKGEPVDPNYIACLLTEYNLGQKNSALVKTVSLGRIVDEVARARNIKTYISKVGRSYVRRLALEKKADLGVEKSGHYFFKEFYYGDSAVLALLHVLKIMSKTVKPLSKLILPYQKYIIWPEASFVYQGHYGHTIKRLKEKFPDGKINDLDGLKIDYPTWGLSLRKSNTENLWRLTMEGLDRGEMEKYKKEIGEVLGS